MKKNKLIVLVTMFSALGVVSYGQCSFDCFLNDYFDVYVETDSLSELVSWNKDIHKWRLVETDSSYACAVGYFPSRDWFSDCAYQTNNLYVLKFWSEEDTEEAHVRNGLLVLCTQSGEIIDKRLIPQSSIDYDDAGREGRDYKVYIQKDMIIWRIYNEKTREVCSEICYRITEKSLVPL